MAESRKSTFKAAKPHSTSITTPKTSLDAQSDYELLGRLIGVRQARRDYQGSLSPLFSQTNNSPLAQRCLVARELVRRWLNEDIRSDSVFRSPKMVQEYLQIHFSGQEYESFVVLHLDAQHRLVKAEDMFRGTLTQTAVYPREIVKSALRHNSAAVIFSHNHPSGVCEPSQADQLLTQSLRSALGLVDVQVLDHLIIAEATAYSFAEHGQI